jgi:hypothetical protein
MTSFIKDQQSDSILFLYLVTNFQVLVANRGSIDVWENPTTLN